MSEIALIPLAAIIILGILAQWIGWRLRLPSILVLLLFGLLAGPATGLLHPDQIMGDLIFPIVSLSVALILFEGGLSLHLAELREAGHTVRNLVTLGALVVWAVTALFAYLLLDLSPRLSVLLGAIMIVSGPTVVQPLLLHVRPTRRVFNILKWEGIVIDPVGATIAVLVFQVTVSEISGTAAIGLLVVGVLITLITGLLVGLLFGGLIILLMRRYLLPEFLQNPAALVLVISAYTLANVIEPESGLLAVTVMGIFMANQPWVNIRHIVEFKENLRTLLLSGLFILLAARIDAMTLLGELRWPTLLFLAVLILIARPLSVLLSTATTGLSWRERGFLAWMAPRGIIAASVSSVFALRLAQEGFTEAERLVPLTFLMIIGTVLIYGLTSMPVGRMLGVSQPSPQGTLIIGAHAWAQSIAIALKQAGFRVLMVDTNPANVQSSLQKGLEAYHGSILGEDFFNDNDLTGIGKLIALTSNPEVNSLAAIRMSEIFGRSEVYQLCSQISSNVSQDLCGRALFASWVDFDKLAQRFDGGADIREVKLNGGHGFAQLVDSLGGRFLPMFLLSETGSLQVFTAENTLTPREQQTVLGLFDKGVELPEV